MLAIHVRQRFQAPIQEVFDAISKHKLLSDNLPFVFIDVVKQSENNNDGLDSVRAIGLPFFKPLKEQVVVFEPPYRLEYKVVGLVARLIKHHHGIIECTQAPDSTNTFVDYHIHLDSSPKALNTLTLRVLERAVRQALAKQAKKLRK